METRLNLIKKCEVCPHRCKIDRTKNQIGRCKSKDTVKVAIASIHKFEEPCISGRNGSGTVFFSNCNLLCEFCQNYEISQQGLGKEISVERLAEIFIEQQLRGAENINLVSPTSYAVQIIEAIKIAKSKGLKIPIIYNTNGYENVETIKLLNGYIDVYLPDLKYAENDLAKKYSKIENYFEIATSAIKEMYRQVGENEYDENGIIKAGIIIRHLILPNHTENSKKVLKWIAENMPKNITVSVMAQYFPTYKAKEIKDINRKITKYEYQKIENYLYSLELENGYIQEMGNNEEIYVPKWEINV
jgi:putative pyruvate formate lyase activating enzyme